MIYHGSNKLSKEGGNSLDAIRISYDISSAGTVANGAIYKSFKNPYGRPIGIINAVFIVKTQSTVASTVDAGVAADATTVANNVLNEKAATAVGILAGTPRIWNANQFLNVSKKTGAINGLEGKLVLDFVYLD